MTEAARLQLRARVKEHEGLRMVMYQDSLGFWTIGYGRMIDPAKGGAISQDEAEYMLANDLRRCERQCETLECYHDLSPARQGVLIEMCFNLGFGGLQGFKRTLAAISRQEYAAAASYMLESRWAGQVRQRAHTLAQIMRTG